jgi:Bacterial Ig-like domain (group 2)
MIESSTAYRRLIAVLGIAGLASACGDAVEPVAVASVEVTSTVGALLDVGGSAQLSATAKDQDGKAVGGVSFTWTSSNRSIVSVDAAGVIEALGVGPATIRADAAGVGGSIAVRVVDADLAGITALATDAYVTALIGASSGEMLTRIQAALADCTAGAGQGRLESIQDCTTAIKAEATSASDPTDRVLLAVLSLFVDQIERLLNL